MVKIGEETGTLDDVMNGLTHHYEREDEIEKSIKSALTYPLIMVAMMIAVIVILVAEDVKNNLLMTAVVVLAVEDVKNIMIIIVLNGRIVVINILVVKHVLKM